MFGSYFCFSVLPFYKKCRLNFQFALSEKKRENDQEGKKQFYNSKLYPTVALYFGYCLYISNQAKNFMKAK